VATHRCCLTRHGRIGCLACHGCIAQRSGSCSTITAGCTFFSVTNQCLQLSVGLYFVPRLDNAEETYGALGGVLVLLTYLLLVGWLMVLALEFNARGHEWRRLRSEEKNQRTV